MDLPEFLNARIAEAEEVARAASSEGSRWHVSSPSGVWSDDPQSDPVFPVVYDEGRPLPEQAAHIARWDPAHVLAWCAAVRLLVEWGRSEADDGPTASDAERAALWTLRVLAQPFADHPDFDPAWR